MQKLIGILLIIASLAGMYYYVDATKNASKTGSNYYKIMEYDLDNNYPKEPIEVLKIFCETVRYLYGEDTISKKDIIPSEVEDIIYKQRKLLDQEVLDSNPESVQYERAKMEIKKYKDSGSKITRIKIHPDIKQETDEIISLTVSEYINKGEVHYFYYYLRKSQDGNWKVLGWNKITDNSSHSNT